MEEEGKKKNWAKIILGWGAVVGALGYLAYRGLSAPPDEKKKALEDPETAMNFYLKTAYAFMHEQRQNGGSFEDVQRVVTDGDWDWFNQNYEHMSNDIFKIGSAIDPNQAKALFRTVVLNALLDNGPCRLDCPIIDKNIGPVESILTVRKDEDEFFGVDIKVHLLKQGKYWKVANFAGGRAIAEHTAAPGDFRHYQRTKDGKRIARDETGKEVELPPNPGGAPDPAPPPKKEVIASKPPATPGDTTNPAAASAPTAGAPPANAGAPAPSVGAQPPAPPAGGMANRRAGRGGGAPAPPPAGATGSASAPAGGTPPGAALDALLAPANALLAQAAKDWEAQDYGRSITNAEGALALYKRHLGENNPKVDEVKKMIEAARAKQN